MERRKFIKLLSGSSVTFVSSPLFGFHRFSDRKKHSSEKKSGYTSDLVIAGGGLGGCAAAMAALRNGLSVIMTEETDWIGGQLTQQGVPPDEHQWIETHGCTQLYRKLRTAIRAYYKKYYPLTKKAKSKEYLNPGDGSVSRLCAEPRPALEVLRNMFAPYLSEGTFTLLLRHKIVEADVGNNMIRSLTALDERTKTTTILEAPYFIDATELGDLLPITGTEYVTGTESKKQTGELHAPKTADPNNQQSINYCFAMDYVPGSDNTIDKPPNYDYWSDFVPQLDPPWPGKLFQLNYYYSPKKPSKKLGFNPKLASTDGKLNLWTYRRIINQHNFKPGTYSGDITIVNWPQNDYLGGNLVGVSKQEAKTHVSHAKQLSLSLFYWLQTEVPRTDGRQGWPGLRLRPNIMGTNDGMAKYPYIRESRRIKSVFTILEKHVGKENRALITGKDPSNVSAANFFDSVGVGYYPIDVHSTTRGDNSFGIKSLPFQIPMGALLPKRMNNLLPANKNIGTTHITNGCYRLHPVEWNIGESAGMLVAYALNKKVKPDKIRGNKHLLREFQNLIRSQGIETHWPSS